MSRDDTVLYTGTTSASFTSPKAEEVKDKQRTTRDARKERSHKLKPAAEPVLALVQKYKDKVMLITEFSVETMVTDEHFKAEIMARKKFYQFLLQFESDIKVALKEYPDER